jgi:uncharacterized membrane protein
MDSNMWRTVLRPDLRVPLFTLATASALGIALIAARTVLAWRGQHLYLVWNLFLAWIPVVLALWLEECDRRSPTKDWRFWAAAFAWLMFFPNAPYLLTDLKHLKLATKLQWWTDLILILLFAITGLVLAFLSLHRMHTLVSRRRGWIAGWVFVLGVAFLTGFGVYLGRFERWNSWDVLIQPLALVADSPNWLHYHTAKFTGLFGLLLATTYALLYSLTRLGVSTGVDLASQREALHPGSG